MGSTEAAVGSDAIHGFAHVGTSPGCRYLSLTGIFGWRANFRPWAEPSGGVALCVHTHGDTTMPATLLGEHLFLSWANNLWKTTGG